MHVITTLRTYLGMTQTQLAEAAGVSQCDISEMSTQPPYGKIYKYQKLSKYLGVPMEALVKNAHTAIPESFFDCHPAPVYTPAPEAPMQLLGRLGEEFILSRERARLQESYPALSKLILPHFKMKSGSPGYDILTFDDAGKPYYLEIKTSTYDSGGFRLTNHELDVAQERTEAGERYDICCISRWGHEDQTVEDITFTVLQNTHTIKPCYYFCRPKPEKRTVTGLAYYRHLRGYTQEELAEILKVGQKDLSYYENGICPGSVRFYTHASQVLDVPIDALLEEHEYPFRFGEAS